MSAIKNPLFGKKQIQKQLNPEEQHIGYRRYNSYTANLPRQQYQLDMAYMHTWLRHHDVPDSATYPYILVCVDIFSKKAHIEALQNKSPHGVVQAFVECIKAMQPPTTVYTDAGTEFMHEAFQHYCKVQGIHHIAVTRSKAPYAEAMVYTFKRFVMNLIESNQMETLQNAIAYFNRNYNKDPKDGLKVKGKLLTPNEADHDENAPELKARFMARSLNNKTGKYPRRYDKLEVGDRVYTFIGQQGRGYVKTKFYNAGRNMWSKEQHTITHIENKFGSKYYYLDDENNPATDKGWLRFQLFKALSPEQLKENKKAVAKGDRQLKKDAKKTAEEADLELIQEL